MFFGENLCAALTAKGIIQIIDQGANNSACYDLT